ncbi:MAG TPA: hypothetical protein VLX11_15950, partial [Candidatus Acidoferrales bacterium]|nr:hypothetical protein [Candidatus Acidoferrales bacterium]
MDGFEESIAVKLMEAGELPALGRLRAQSACYLLDHGAAQRTGLAWEHVSSGLSPDKACRWAAVHFDPETYAVWQEGTRLQPFPGRLKSRTVVFDAPYFDLDQAPQARGLVGWGAHDPGVRLMARPVDLLSEFRTRFGDYPAEEWIYGHVWASPARAHQMGKALADAVRVRARAARWLLAERLPDWDFALIVVSEPHSAIEGLWHGIDVSHRLHCVPSASAAHDGLLGVYRAIDSLVDELASVFRDSAIVVFSMGGMGPNRSDVASMVLLPELMYRHSFGRPYLKQPAAWTELSRSGPQLEENQEWAPAINMNFDPGPLASPKSPTLIRRLKSHVQHAIRRITQNDGVTKNSPPRPSIGWMPATRYQQYWNSMRAFALPSYYDGRIRINLEMRERCGMIPVAGYQLVCEEIEALLRECRDPATGD